MPALFLSRAIGVESFSPDPSRASGNRAYDEFVVGRNNKEAAIVEPSKHYIDLQSYPA
jgi:hypothetical protein